MSEADDIHWHGMISNDRVEHIDAEAWAAIRAAATPGDATMALNVVEAVRALRSLRDELARVRDQRDKATAKRRIITVPCDRRYRVNPRGTPECLREFGDALIELPVPIRRWPCIYFLFNRGTLAYVGQSNNVSSRLATHQKNGKEFDRVLALPTPAENLNETERCLIQRFLPPLNATCIPEDILRSRRTNNQGDQ